MGGGLQVLRPWEQGRLLAAEHRGGFALQRWKDLLAAGRAHSARRLLQTLRLLPAPQGQLEPGKRPPPSHLAERRSRGTSGPWREAGSGLRWGRLQPSPLLTPVHSSAPGGPEEGGVCRTECAHRAGTSALGMGGSWGASCSPMSPARAAQPAGIFGEEKVPGMKAPARP